MTEDSNVRVSSSNEAPAANEASQTRQRKKRKWDQPAESLPDGMAVTGVFPLCNSVPLGGVVYPGVTSAISGALLTNPLAAAALLQQQSTAVTQKLNQIQDELVIAREIVINDAESSIRYKLTKRQTQEEIQRCTGTIVITRGKYRPPNVPLDGEKPLYLHISAGAHIKDTAERILVVDRAAAMIEEILRPGQNSQSISSASPSTLANGLKVLSTCVFLGFDADPSWNIVARIRGPNDQYINHITNETGATVILRGSGSGNDEGLNGEDGQQPMHLFLSSNNAKSLEQAKSLAENLLDTISMECGASRISSCKAYSAVPPPQPVYTAVPPPQPVYTAVPSPQQVYSGPTAILPLQQGYSAVPPPQQLLAGVQSLAASTGVTTTSMSLTAVSTPIPLANTIGYTPPLVSGGTSYIGYGGIYPQATPLQQVALALRHPPPVASIVAPATSGSSRESKSTTSSDHEKEDKRPSLRRKFQELPVVSKSTKHNQGLELLKPNERYDDLVVRNISNMPAPKKLIPPSSSGIQPPPPRTMPPPPPPKRAMPPPPPPPKFYDSTEVKVQDRSNNSRKTKPNAVPETLVKLMEYGDDDDDDLDDSNEEILPRTTKAIGAQKPFWAL
ncbi:unnamed protein product [Lathyrus sativus]|nr:unnamed protein product [Lathyrus sativus]